MYVQIFAVGAFSRTRMAIPSCHTVAFGVKMERVVGCRLLVTHRFVKSSSQSQQISKVKTAPNILNKKPNESCAISLMYDISVRWYRQLGVSPQCAGFNKGQRASLWLNCTAVNSKHCRHCSKLWIVHCSEQCRMQPRLQCSLFHRGTVDSAWAWFLATPDFLQSASRPAHRWTENLKLCAVPSQVQSSNKLLKLMQVEKSGRHCNLSVNWKQGLAAAAEWHGTRLWPQSPTRSTSPETFCAALFAKICRDYLCWWKFLRRVP